MIGVVLKQTVEALAVTVPGTGGLVQGPPGTISIPKSFQIVLVVPVVAVSEVPEHLLFPTLVLVVVLIPPVRAVYWISMMSVFVLSYGKLPAACCGIPEPDLCYIT